MFMSPLGWQFIKGTSFAGQWVSWASDSVIFHPINILSLFLSHELSRISVADLTVGFGQSVERVASTSGVSSADDAVKLFPVHVGGLFRRQTISMPLLASR